MTHYLRSRHDAILIGVGTAEADDPSLNCRLDMSTVTNSHDTHATGQSHQPRPIILDPHARWDVRPESKVIQLAKAGQGLAPFVLTVHEQPAQKKWELLEQHGGRYIAVRASSAVNTTKVKFAWDDVFRALAEEGLHSVMVEGGGTIIDSLLSVDHRQYVNSVIVTIAPVWLGQGGVFVSPPRSGAQSKSGSPVAQLDDVSWHPLGRDVVMCGRMQQNATEAPS
jgi:2,5-diamino-6-(ribosylamino)-4(3H)-pyrimidinone 5'-phosphate reductase